MKLLLRSGFLLLLAVSTTFAEPVSLVKAAELATRFMETEKIGDKPIIEIFKIIALRRVQHENGEGPAEIVWRAELAETEPERTDPAMKVRVKEDGRSLQRVLEIRGNQAVVLTKIAAQPRMRIVPPSQPKPTVVPPSDPAQK